MPILLGDRTDIKNRAMRLDIRLDGIRIVEPSRSDDFEVFLTLLGQMPRFQGLSDAEKRELLLDNNYFATLMLRTSRADALVGGATVMASSALRPIFQVVGTKEGVKSASSLLILDQEDSKIGINGVIFLADCGVIPDPTPEQLASIAVTTADIAQHLTGAVPRVALLSFATRAKNPIHPSILKIREALEIAQRMAAERKVVMEIDGEMQVDAALDSVVAQNKRIEDSPVAGRANVLIFPDLNSANIASKLVQQIAGTRSYGQIITGLNRPCAEISRGAHAIDIFGAAVIVGCQALDKSLLGTVIPNS